jgi:NADPH-dependent 2,4-dienoyl-CoA reductase/sulfur reductase-like enzyme
MLYPDNGRLTDWLRTQVLKLPVDIRLGQEVTPEFVKEVDPQIVIVAVGARREPPPIEGVGRRHVLGGDDLRSLMTGSDSRAAEEKLTFIQRLLLNLGKVTGFSRNQPLVRAMTKYWMPIGNRVAIVGGGLVGVEVAAFLAERKRQVFLIEEGRKLASELAVPRRWRVLHELREMGVDVHMETKVESIGEKEVALVSAGGDRKSVEIDSVIIATGVREDLSLCEDLRGLGYDVHLAGDCSGVGYIEGAMRDASRIAWEI